MNETPIPLTVCNPWDYEAWVIRLGGLPTEVLAHEDRSGGYEQNSAHVFKIRPGRYALVTESGCSCYSSRDAAIYIYGRASDALKDFKAYWEDRDAGRYAFVPGGNKA